MSNEPIQTVNKKVLDIAEEIDLIQYVKNYVHNKNGKLFNLYVSGSHMYGFDSPDSDVDIRGCYGYDKRKFLGLEYNHKKDVLHIGHENDKYDMEVFELRKLITLAIKGNCNILEELNAQQIFYVADYRQLRQMLNNTYGKNGLYNSYKGLAEFNYRKFIKQGRNTVKKYLYVYRGLMAGTYALRTGKIQANIYALNKYFRDEYVKQLIEAKRGGSEQMALESIDSGELDASIQEYFAKIGDAYDKSLMPERPSDDDVEKINKWLIDFRLGE
jgi:predicted nucleotidyltransferase